EVLRQVGLTEVANKRAGGFSLGMSQRLGLAGALLGDPQVLLFDEPVNGLDPEGIVWIRRFMQALAAEGRTVLVSSHLLSEMAQTADHLLVIGRGRLIADTSVDAFVAQASEAVVRVRSPQLDVLRAALVERGHAVHDDDGALVVTGATAAEVGELAAARSVVLHELAGQQASLEEAFMKMTGGDVQFHGTGADSVMKGGL
ncbi:AAA family ATPase, partial [Rhodococcus sp. CX]